jgi:hypothetical protein
MLILDFRFLYKIAIMRNKIVQLSRITGIVAHMMLFDNPKPLVMKPNAKS